MSLELIGNGILPYVHTDNIMVEEKSATLKYNCKVYDYFIDFNSNTLLWTDSAFLDSEIFLCSFVTVGNKITDGRDLIQRMNNRNEFDSVVTKHLGKVIDDTLKNRQNQRRLQNPNSLTIAQPSSDDTVFYSQQFNHNLDTLDNTSGNVYVYTFIFYKIEEGSNIIDKNNKFLIGPALLDIVRENGIYKTTSYTLTLNGSIYRGPTNTRNINSRPQSGVLGGQPLGVAQQSRNPKLYVSRVYNMRYPEKELVKYNNNTFDFNISIPMWSFWHDTNEDLVKVRALFGFKANDLSSYRFSPLVSYNFMKLKNYMTCYLKCEGIVLDISRELRKVKINSISTPYEFFEIEAEIPRQFSQGSVTLHIDFNISVLSATQILDSFLTANQALTIKNNFLDKNRDNEDIKKFIKYFLLILSCNRDITEQELQAEKAILINSLFGDLNEEAETYMQDLATTFSEEYSSFRKKTESFAKLEIKRRGEWESNPRNFIHIKQGKSPRYFSKKLYAEGQAQVGAESITGNNENYITIGDLRRRLQIENTRMLLYPDPSILEGTQQLLPIEILKTKIERFSDIFAAAPHENLYWYESKIMATSDTENSDSRYYTSEHAEVTDASSLTTEDIIRASSIVQEDEDTQPVYTQVADGPNLIQSVKKRPELLTKRFLK